MLGKRVADELYLHRDVLDRAELPEPLRQAALEALRALPCQDPAPNVLKLNTKTGRFSWLSYQDFEHAAFPELICSWSYSPGQTAQPTLRRYDSSLNPPILHRKELLVGPDHPMAESWRALTKSAEAIGLFDDTSVIGFKQNWERLIAAKGYQIQDHALVPLGNELVTTDGETPTDWGPESLQVQRHLTALYRSALSAPVQALLRHQLLSAETSFFDYGCGRGGDVHALRAEGFEAQGWDPYFAKEASRVAARVVNLGFVINVIEDPAERAEALHQAFKLCEGVLAVAVMLHNSSETQQGLMPYADGVLTSRRTFQKYFSQSEFKEYLEHALGQTAYLVGPGIAFLFADKALEQRFESARYRRRGLMERLVASARYAGPRRERSLSPARERRPVFEGPPRPSAQEAQLMAAQPWLEACWRKALDLGRWPEEEGGELAALPPLPEGQSLPKLMRRLREQFDLQLLQAAAQVRADDVLVYLATQRFGKRRPYGSLEPRLQRDIKAFFGSYASAQAAALALLRDTADPAKLLAASQRAAEQGLGWLEGEGHSLQLHIDLVERLPALLRVYVACGLILWDAISAVQVVKIHIHSGKLTLLEFAEGEFDTTPLPRLQRRIKVNLRKLDYDLFEYGSAEYPMPLLYRKSRYLHEESPGYAEQLAFDEALAASGVLNEAGDHGPPAAALAHALELKRLGIQGMRLGRSERIPDLDQPCGANFTYRSFIECGETQQRLQLRNIPLRPETYNALYDLATQILDPVIEYFGAIRLTYGFCGPELGKHIKSRVAPKLDQHACWERNRTDKLICERGGAACDFLVEDENMLEVGRWIARHLPFDRLYYYGPSLALHVSVGPQCARSTVSMVSSPGGRRTPRALSFDWRPRGRLWGKTEAFQKTSTRP